MTETSSGREKVFTIFRPWEAYEEDRRSYVFAAFPTLPKIVFGGGVMLKRLIELAKIVRDEHGYKIDLVRKERVRNQRDLFGGLYPLHSDDEAFVVRELELDSQ